MLESILKSSEWAFTLFGTLIFWFVAFAIAVLALIVAIKATVTFKDFILKLRSDNADRKQKSKQAFADELASKIGAEFGKELIRAQQAAIKQPSKAKMFIGGLVGNWEDSSGNKFTIEENGGYFTVRFIECMAPCLHEFENKSYIIRGYYGSSVLTLEAPSWITFGYDKIRDTLFFSEANITFNRVDVFNFSMPVRIKEIEDTDLHLECTLK